MTTDPEEAEATTKKCNNQTRGENKNEEQWKVNGNSPDDWFLYRKWLCYYDKKDNEDETGANFSPICQET